MKTSFNVAVMALALCVLPINVAAQEQTNTVVVNSVTRAGIEHDETFEHSYVVIRRNDGSLAIGFYKITAKFEGNNPVMLLYNLVSSTDDALFKIVPVLGMFESEAKGKNAFEKFTDLFYTVYGKSLVEVKFER